MPRTPLKLAAAALVGALPPAVPVTAAAAPATTAAAECGATLSDYMGDTALDSQFTGTLATGTGPVAFTVTPKYLPNVVRVVAEGASDGPSNGGAKEEPPATGTLTTSSAPATGAVAKDAPPTDGSMAETSLTVRQTGNGRQGVVFETPRGEAESDGVLCSDADSARPTRVVEITGTVWSGGDGLQEFSLQRS